jgi:hypothetical protein
MSSRHLQQQPTAPQYDQLPPTLSQDTTVPAAPAGPPINEIVEEDSLAVAEHVGGTTAAHLEGDHEQLREEFVRLRVRMQEIQAQGVQIEEEELPAYE